MLANECLRTKVSRHEIPHSRVGAKNAPLSAIKPPFEEGCKRSLCSQADKIEGAGMEEKGVTPPAAQADEREAEERRKIRWKGTEWDVDRCIGQSRKSG